MLPTNVSLLFLLGDSLYEYIWDKHNAKHRIDLKVTKDANGHNTEKNLPDNKVNIVHVVSVIVVNIRNEYRIALHHQHVLWTTKLTDEFAG